MLEDSHVDATSRRLWMGRVGMDQLEARINELLDDPKKIERLLLLEKERRGLPKDSLVFVGMLNVAKYWWCAIQALLNSRENEAGFFTAYLQDRLMYSSRLGLIDRLPRRRNEILEIGNNIRFADIERLLKESPEGAPDRDLLGWILGGENPDELEDSPTSRGLLHEATIAERWPTIRWNFKWENYAVIGVPDGIREETIYEFKSTRTDYLMHFVKPVALTQADLYGYFFKRNKKRVQIHIVEERRTETWEENIDKGRARKTLSYFRKAEKGWLPPPPKVRWKCKNCEFTDVCNVYAG